MADRRVDRYLERIVLLVTSVLTLFIHVGFFMYEVGTAPTKTMLHLEHRCGLGPGAPPTGRSGAMRRHFAMNRSIGM
jgi:hypothetical protein